MPVSCCVQNKPSKEEEGGTDSFTRNQKAPDRALLSKKRKGAFSVRSSRRSHDHLGTSLGGVMKRGERRGPQLRATISLPRKSELRQLIEGQEKGEGRERGEGGSGTTIF